MVKLYLRLVIVKWHSQRHTPEKQKNSLSLLEKEELLYLRTQLLLLEETLRFDKIYKKSQIFAHFIENEQVLRNSYALKLPSVHVKISSDFKDDGRIQKENNSIYQKNCAPI
jgi:hypothetical protein